MTRVLVQRGSAGSSTSSSNQNRPSTSASASTPSSSSASPQQQVPNSSQAVSALKDENMVDEVQDQIVTDEQSELVDISDIRSKENRSGDLSSESLTSDHLRNEKNVDDEKVLDHEDMVSGMIQTGLNSIGDDNDATVGSSSQMIIGSSNPPPPPVPPPKPSLGNSNSQRFPIGDSNAVRIESSRRAAGLPVSIRSSSTGSRPSSPRSHCEGEGYNSADEQSPNFSSNYHDAEREQQFEIDLRRHKGLEVRKMLEDGNCLFRAVADQVYGDSDQYGMVRQMCIDYMEKERDHFSQFMTESFTSYCKRKRRDKVYGNNMEIQALSEMYNRPIHIYSYSTEPINTFQAYETDTAPIRLSYHRGNHYNSLVDPRRPTIGVGLGFSSLQGNNIDKDQVKAAIKAQQDQQINNALLAEGRYYSDLELTEKEIERNVMEASRAEYIAGNLKQQIGYTESSSTSRAEPSSSAARPVGSDSEPEGRSGPNTLTPVLSDENMQLVMSMGFSYFQVVEAFSIFGNDVDSMVCYLIETNGSGSGRRKGKATE